uniref:Uncharacterized protein n=1 Tax=Beihai levi-like virus 4 TaxID=1922422 RepID=A0A1L3KI11_9VIRU|nr:hypothetical protein [Beihai levi-like virus 4]
MTERTRYRSWTTPYSAVRNGTPQSRETVTAFGTCTDVVGNYPNANPLDIHREWLDGCTIDWYVSEKNFAYGPAYSWRNALGSIPDGDFVSDNSAAVKLHAAGPISPQFNLPVSIFELRDIPRMLRHAGDLLHKLKRPSGLNPVQEAAAANLAYEFGWAPLISDLKTCFKFAEMTDKRRKRLSGLDQGKHISTRVNLHASSRDDEFQAYLHTIGPLVRASVHRHIAYEQWATCKWRVKDPGSIGTIVDEYGQMSDAIGLSTRNIPLAVWKVLKWSWIIDWFVNISDLLKATQNSAVLAPYNACVMRRTTVKSNVIGNNLMSGGVAHGKTMLRHPIGLSTYPPLQLPIIDNFRAGILASLTVTRMGRR